jgi:hypothetical protein
MTVVNDLQIVVVEINCQLPLIASRVHSAPDKSTTYLAIPLHAMQSSLNPGSSQVSPFMLSTFLAIEKM